MRFYTTTHNHYCGIDLHAKTMYLCILDREGKTVLHENMRSRPEEFLAAVEPFRDDLVVAVECIFTWYWLADLCRNEGIEFVLGHALYTTGQVQSPGIGTVDAGANVIDGVVSPTP